MRIEVRILEDLQGITITWPKVVMILTTTIGKFSLFPTQKIF